MFGAVESGRGYEPKAGWQPVEKPATDMRIRPAVAHHVPAIAALVEEQARRGNLLPRSYQSILNSLPDWLVAEADGELLGCAALHRFSSGLVEVRSLAVADQAQGRGIGSHLLTAAIHVARERQAVTLFALTRAVPFFERAGFSVVERSLFPEKVWIDCHKCPVRHHCDETAVALNLVIDHQSARVPGQNGTVVLNQGASGIRADGEE
jgi:N-acetylglutamate synthase-like GNAT family acetyltransferase